MNEQPIKSKKSHYILTFVIGISVIGVIILILGIATNWFRGSSPAGPAGPAGPNGGSPGGYNCINTPTPAHPDGAYICTPETGGPYAAGCYESGPTSSVGTGCGGTHPETPAPGPCPKGKWSTKGIEPCKTCSTCSGVQIVDNPCTSTTNTTCKDPAPGPCPIGKWSAKGIEPCTPCKPCPAGQVVDNPCTSTANTTCKGRLPTSCPIGKWSTNGIEPCKTCSKCQYGVEVACTTKSDTRCDPAPGPCPKGKWSAKGIEPCTPCKPCPAGQVVDNPCTSTANTICKPKPPPGPSHYSCNFVSGLVSPNTCRVANKVPASVDVPPQICQDWEGADAQKKAQTACLYDGKGNPTASGCSFTYDGGPGDNLPSCADSPTECCWFASNNTCTGTAPDMVYFTGQYRSDLICQGSPFQAQDKCLLASQEGDCITPGASIPNRPCGSGWVEDSKTACCDSTTSPFKITQDLCNCSVGWTDKLKVGDYGYNACTNADDY